MKPKAILLLGPTASGKTALAIELANKFNGEIINADSRQFYKKMPIITAMPDDEEFAQATHHLFDILEPDDNFSAAKYINLAKQVAQDITNRGKLPIFVGGTGLYIKALEDGLSPSPRPDAELVEQLNLLSFDELISQLNELDPDVAKNIKLNDRYRAIVALRTIKQTGKSITYWQSLPNTDMLDYDFIHLSLNPEREVLYSRINKRADKMVDLGVIDEVKALLDEYGEDKLNSLTSIGFDIFVDALKDNIETDKAIELFAQKQRNYAKRQVTWMRNQYPNEHTCDDLNVTFEFLERRLKQEV
ncbi:MAG: tRNA dimethylallyltransferase [Proteobacteria bacterium]|nr:MAG: tRNA dimethylallyltransferase [Pseudomonadota bacterium]